jgi:signal transduction histidine kinase
LAKVVLIAVLAASEVVLAAACGASLIRVIILSLAAAVFVVSSLTTASAGRCHYDARDLTPVLAMVAAVVVGIAVTGGITSPMLALFPAPFLIGWTMFAGSRTSTILGALIPVTFVGYLVMPAALTAMPLEHDGFVAIAVWSSMLSLSMIARRIRLLFDAIRSTFSSLDLVRNGALSDADSRRRGIESMSTKLAHELKNPLAAIKSLVQLEQRNPAHNDKTKTRLDVVYTEAERIQAILADYLNLQRPIDVMSIAPVEVGTLMDEVRALLAGRAESAGVELVLHGSGGQLDADSRLLKEAIVNLASNAILATPRGGLVEMTYRIGPRGASIVVRDTGSGMTKEICDRIGTPFFTTREGGTGLGVAIARSAIDQHHGQLAYSSTPGNGTIATVTLPPYPHKPHGIAA